jgi:hypothetical protein
MVWILDKNGITKDIVQIGVTDDANPEVINVNSDEYCIDIIVDKNKNFYCGVVHASSYGENSGGANDATIVKWNSNNNLEWITQLGASTFIPGFNNAGTQVIQGIGFAADGSIGAVGTTSGSTAAINQGGEDIIIFKLNTSGELIWGRQYGTPAMDTCTNVTTDTSGNLYCAGSTTGSFGETNGGATDALILRVNSLGNF